MFVSLGLGVFEATCDVKDKILPFVTICDEYLVNSFDVVKNTQLHGSAESREEVLSGNLFHITGFLWWESTSQQWMPFII